MDGVRRSLVLFPIQKRNVFQEIYTISSALHAGASGARWHELLKRLSAAPPRISERVQSGAARRWSLPALAHRLAPLAPAWRALELV
jgi:hypothetical protein